MVDDGTLRNRRGSLNVDDEGNPTARNVLIENGILRGYLQDQLSSRILGEQPTGNGRRESYEHIPMPRMTNTFMLAGKAIPATSSAPFPAACTASISAAARWISPAAISYFRRRKVI